MYKRQVTAFTADSNVVVVNSTCDLLCADPDVCDSIVANSTELSNTTLMPGDLEPDGDGIPFAISSTAQFINGFCTTRSECLVIERIRNERAFVQRCLDECPESFKFS